MTRVSAAAVKRALLAGDESRLLDVRSEAVFATAHPLLAASMPVDAIGVVTCG